MSRNSKLREMASKLPSIPKYDVKGKPLRGQFREVLQADHFNNLKDIEYEMAEKGFDRKHIATGRALTGYCLRVVEYDKKIKAKKRRNLHILYVVLTLLGVSLYSMGREYLMEFFRGL